MKKKGWIYLLLTFYTVLHQNKIEKVQVDLK